MATHRAAARTAPSPLLALLLLAVAAVPAATTATAASGTLPVPAEDAAPVSPSLFAPAAGARRRLRRGRRAEDESNPGKEAGGAGEDAKNAGDPPAEVIAVVEDLEQSIEELDATGLDGRAEDALLDEAESLVEATFPEGCSWECYLDNYKGLKNRGFDTEQKAIKHWLDHGRDNGRDCSCKTNGLDEAGAEAAQEVEAIEEVIEELDDEGGEDAAQEKQALEEEVVAAIEETFPEGCSWECYLNNYKGLKNRLHTEEQAIRHWLRNGRKQGKDCSCAVEDAGVDAGVDEEEEEVAQVVGEIEEAIEDLEESGGAVGELEAEELEEKAETLIEETFPEGCSWECYLDNYAGLKQRLHNEKQAIKHWLRKGRDDGWDCRCKTEDIGEEEVAEMVEVLETTIQHLGEEGGAVAEGEMVQLEEEAETLIDETFPKGCTWECYLDNYPGLKQRLHTEEDAIKNWLTHGRDKGKDCTCKGGDTEQEVEIIEETIDELDDEGGASAEREKEELVTKAAKLIQETFPEGCTWECYLENNKGLKRRGIDTEERAIKQWLRNGKNNGRDCTCHEGDVDANDVAEVVEEIEGLIEDLDDEGGTVAEVETEQLEEEAQSLIEAIFPEGCTWQCYLDNNAGLKQRLDNEKQAIRHWLRKGRDDDWDCSCKDQDTGGGIMGDAGFMAKPVISQSQRLGNNGIIKGSNVSEEGDGKEDERGAKQLFGWEFVGGAGTGVAAMAAFILVHTAYKRRASRFQPVQGDPVDEYDGDNNSYQDEPELSYRDNPELT